MNSLFKRFQDVVEMGQEQDSSAHMLAQQPSSNAASSSDPVELRRHIATLTQQLARQLQSYEELRVESVGLEKELTRLRLRFASSRELWDTCNEQLETVVQNLLEHQLYGNTLVTSTRRSTAAGDGSTTASPAGASSSPASLDATYVASLQEQIQRLKEMVQRSGEERTQLRSEKQYEQTQVLLRSSGLAGAGLDAEVRQALEKMLAHWQEERLQYETVIESLEQHVARHAEREALLSDQVKQERERHENAAAAAAQQSAEMEELRAMQAELEEWRSGARALEQHSQLQQQQQHFQDTEDGPVLIGTNFPSGFADQPPARASVTHSPEAQQQEPTPHPGSAATSTAPHPDTTASTPLPPKNSADHPTSSYSSELHAQQQAELEMLRQDYGAREEALDSLYADNKSLQEALQRAEAQARQSDAELQECQLRLEEAEKQLAREQQKVKRGEEECQKAAATEAKLREQVRELRQALAAAAAAADHDAVVASSTGLRGGVTIPQSRGVRVGQPVRYEVAEQAIIYQDGGTWRDWLIEAGRWWSELKGEAMPLQSPLSAGTSLHGRLPGHAGGRSAAAAPRRGRRVMLFFGAAIAFIMLIFLLLVVLEYMYAALRAPES